MSRKKIYVGDINSKNLSIISKYLERFFYDVETYQDGLDLLNSIFDDSKSFPDVVILDIFLKGINGYGVNRILHENLLTADSSIKILYYTFDDRLASVYWSLKCQHLAVALVSKRTGEIYDIARMNEEVSKKADVKGNAVEATSDDLPKILNIEQKNKLLIASLPGLLFAVQNIQSYSL